MIDTKQVGLLGRGRPVDLTGAYLGRLTYEEPSRWQVWKRWGPIGLLIGSNVLTLIVGVMLWGLFQSSMQFNLWLNAAKSKTIQRLTASERAQAAKIEEMENQVERFVEFQKSSPADIVRIGKTIARILSTASGSQRAFLEEALPQAIRIQVAEGIPASAVLGMAIYESGYGSSKLAREHHNYFGMKAFSNWDGPRAVSMTTRDSGVLTQADFRSFGSLYDGFRGFAEFLRNGSRYRAAFEETSGRAFVSQVLRAGYCPDSDYLTAVSNIIQRHRLYELENLLTKAQTEKLPEAASTEVVP
jgi:flagellum-specific peptidoglycan hydrolase FlgJ